VIDGVNAADKSRPIRTVTFLSSATVNAPSRMSNYAVSALPVGRQELAEVSTSEQMWPQSPNGILSTVDFNWYSFSSASLNVGCISWGKRPANQSVANTKFSLAYPKRQNSSFEHQISIFFVVAKPTDHILGVLGRDLGTHFYCHYLLCLNSTHSSVIISSNCLAYGRDRWIMRLCARIILHIIGDLPHNWANPA